VAPIESYQGGGSQIVLDTPPDAWIVGKQSFKDWRKLLGH
jgi:hypothetical protein